MGKKIHIDNGNGLALCGLRTRPGEERGYLGNNPDHGDSITEGAVYEIKIEPLIMLMDLGSRDRCSKCVKKYKKINQID